MAYLVLSGFYFRIFAQGRSTPVSAISDDNLSLFSNLARRLTARCCTFTLLSLCT